VEEDSDSAEYDAANDDDVDAEQNAMQELHEIDLARMDSTAGGGGAGGGGRRKTRPAAKAAARDGQKGRGRGQQAQRGRSSYAARRGRRVVPAGVLRLAEMRLDYVDDLMSAEADDELQAAIAESSRVITGSATRSRELADQNMAPTKCHCLLLQPTEAVGPTTKEDVEALGLNAVSRGAQSGDLKHTGDRAW
jgi:hypothetical protein